MGQPKSDQPDEIVRIDEIAAYLKIGNRTVYRVAANTKLPAFKLGGTWHFRHGDLNEWIASRIDMAVVNGGEGAK